MVRSKRYIFQSEVHERHRHRFEVNPKYIKDLEESGLRFSGKRCNQFLTDQIENIIRPSSIDGKRMEITELKAPHPFFIGVQYHPEFKSRPMYPHPLFLNFIKVTVVPLV